jgi:hypothetical protein
MDCQDHDLLGHDFVDRGIFPGREKLLDSDHSGKLGNRPFRACALSGACFAGPYSPLASAYR